MPRIYNLREYSEKLKSVNLIVGDGLCSNIYVIGNENAIIVDTGIGNSSNRIWPQLNELGITPINVKGIILTHAHHDHAMGAFVILEKADPKVFIQTYDTKYVATRFGPNLVKVDDGDIIETELWPLEVIWTPGHTEGGMCLYNKKFRILFSGDTVFPNGYYGRYDGESGSLKKIVESLKRLTEIEVDIMLPGHGTPVFTNAGEQIQLSYRNASYHA
jgi:glyoxylase-like metal-dependent hydrolase (beta-lactamase superfamily II)